MYCTDIPTLELLKSYDAILEELRKRNIVRNSNPPAGGYGEYLAARALGLDLETNSNADYDATDKKSCKYEIKARRITRHNPSRQLSAIRNIENCHFDFLIGILFLSDFSVFKAALIPRSVVVQKCRFSNHTNSSIFILNDSIWECEGVKDITTVLQEAQAAI
jgi:hypothetical protein